MNWILESSIFHILFLGSIFTIYFWSPVIKNLSPQADLSDPPAKRLVLFVTDGLRAESFFDDNCSFVPEIKEIFFHNGIIGVSHTRVPTESRPGHIALIAGLYEDPTAVTKGWRENPIEFDSVFNRSRKTYAWGNSDILSIFKNIDSSKIEFHAYDHDLDFQGLYDTYELDDWVFSRVARYLMQKRDNLKESKVIYFLHLLGLDTAGHVHKPGSKQFLHNLRLTAHRIGVISRMFRSTFRDGQTAFVLTSDHGMTNHGSHGSGDSHETETPLVAWGAGVGNWRFLPHEIVRKKIDDVEIPSFDIEQADLAPFMASLLGIAVPMNNYGKLPKDMLNATDEYIAKAVFNNALQILAQLEKLMDEFDKGVFSNYIRGLNRFERHVIEEFKMITEMSMAEGDYDSVKMSSEECIDRALKAIEYYQSYYQYPLLYFTTVAFLAWILYLIVLISDKSERPTFKRRNVNIVGFCVILIIASYAWLQNMRVAARIYLILPVCCIMRLLHRCNFRSLMETLKENWTVLLRMIIGAELMVFTFFHREMISIAVLGLTIYHSTTLNKVKYIEGYGFVYLEWIISALLLLLFPLIPLGYLRKNDILVIFGILLLITKLCYTAKGTKNILELLCFLGVTHCLICIFMQNVQASLYSMNLITTWVVSAAALVSPLVYNSQPNHRTTAIFFCFSIPYFHLSISYEMIFFTLFGIHILNFIILKGGIDESLIPTVNASKQEESENSPHGVKFGENLNLSLTILLFIFLSFFGTGNMASISSFDPTVARFFVTTFSPFTMMALIILKLVIPLVVLLSAFMALTYHRKIDERKLFLSLLLICDMMGLNFLYMVTNKGSWLEIGTSISHFVIMEVTTFVVAIVCCVSKCLLFVDVQKVVKTRMGKLL